MIFIAISILAAMSFIAVLYIGFLVPDPILSLLDALKGFHRIVL
jgi:hypothetical protein